MKTSRLGAFLAVFVSLCCFASLARAQGPMAPIGQPGPGSMGAGSRIALLDVSYIFSHHVRLKGMVEDLKREMQQAEAWRKSEYETMAKQREELQTYHKGTPQFKEMEENLANREAQFKVQMQLKKKDLIQKEYGMYNTVYQEILQATDLYCRQNGIDMVVQFKGDSVDPQQPESVAMFIQRPVVWYNKGLDITPIVLQELNRGTGTVDRRNMGMPQQPARVPFGAR